MLTSQFNDVLWISIDDSGYVTAITETTSSTEKDSCKDFNKAMMGIDSFNTDVLIKHTELAPVCDTASFIQKVEREREAREKGGNENKGFLAKYVSLKYKKKSN